MTPEHILIINRIAFGLMGWFMGYLVAKAKFKDMKELENESSK